MPAIRQSRTAKRATSFFADCQELLRLQELGKMARVRQIAISLLSANEYPLFHY